MKKLYYYIFIGGFIFLIGLLSLFVYVELIKLSVMLWIIFSIIALVVIYLFVYFIIRSKGDVKKEDGLDIEKLKLEFISYMKSEQGILPTSIKYVTDGNVLYFSCVNYWNQNVKSYMFINIKKLTHRTIEIFDETKRFDEKRIKDLVDGLEGRERVKVEEVPTEKLREQLKEMQKQKDTEKVIAEKMEEIKKEEEEEKEKAI